MSNWVELRDSLVGNLSFDKVTEDMKVQFTAWLLETALPLAENAATSFISQVKEQSKSETGWCKIRDLVVLPAVINGGLWLVETTLTKSANATATATETASA